MPDPGATVGQLITTYWPVPAVSLGVSLVLTPVCRRIALAAKIVDQPDDYLKPHANPVPYLGGLAILLGWAAGLAWAGWRCAGSGPAGPEAATPSLADFRTAGVVAAAAIITAVGLLDDVRRMSPGGRLLITLLAGALLVACGLGDDFVPVLARNSGVLFLPDNWLLALVLTVPLTLFVVVGACNATNVLDGLDGLCAGVLSIVHAGFLGLALFLHGSGSEAADPLRIVLAAAGLGAALGFLPFNRHPASIFMGDAGSMFLGFNAAVLILLFAESGLLKFALAALMVFAVPVADMALAMVRRRRAGRPLTIGDRSHFYDQLVDRGYSVPRVVAIAYALAAGYAMLGWLAIVLPTGYVIALFLTGVLATCVAIYAAGMVRTDSADSRL